MLRSGTIEEGIPIWLPWRVNNDPCVGNDDDQQLLALILTKACILLVVLNRSILLNSNCL